MYIWHEWPGLFCGVDYELQQLEDDMHLGVRHRLVCIACLVEMMNPFWDYSNTGSTISVRENKHDERTRDEISLHHSIRGFSAAPRPSAQIGAPNAGRPREALAPPPVLRLKV
jgi:hypothetical protein